jgi:16S rRNA (guanine527-N7)-methyltransferase
MKGHYLKDEVQELEATSEWQVKSWQTLKVVDMDAERCLIWMSRKG